MPDNHKEQCIYCGLPGVKPMADRDPILVEREKTHGSFQDVAGCAQDLKAAIRNRKLSSSNIDERQIEALDLICTKIARIICGNPMEPDHWVDIAGYAKLGAEACPK